MRKFLFVSVMALVLAVAALTGSARVTQAYVSWSMSDLGPMATRAEDTGNIPQHVLDKVVATPVQSVSTDKGGTNTHK
ncbi:MAG: hypothetical protein HYY01_07330 [Chloroflexi bacterium]|nr:hypothetical protein [Chloroflexota bacterium]